jgi:hypothetical protein
MGLFRFGEGICYGFVRVSWFRGLVETVGSLGLIWELRILLDS